MSTISSKVQTLLTICLDHKLHLYLLKITQHLKKSNNSKCYLTINLQVHLSYKAHIHNSFYKFLKICKEITIQKLISLIINNKNNSNSNISIKMFNYLKINNCCSIWITHQMKDQAI